MAARIDILTALSLKAMRLSGCKCFAESTQARLAGAVGCFLASRQGSVNATNTIVERWVPAKIAVHVGIRISCIWILQWHAVGIHRGASLVWLYRVIGIAHTHTHVNINGRGTSLATNLGVGNWKGH